VYHPPLVYDPMEAMAIYMPARVGNLGQARVLPLLAGAVLGHKPVVRAVQCATRCAWWSASQSRRVWSVVARRPRA
jgi:hypothetical protein